VWVLGAIKRRPMFTIRYEHPEDHVAIHAVHSTAFGRPHEGNLVDALRRAEALTISLVAVHDSRIVGHIAFSPVTVTSSTTTIEALGLGPLAVLPACQRHGIGAQLVSGGLAACRATPYGVVVVLGPPDYYPRFGFTTARHYGIVWEHNVPEGAFMVQELKSGALGQIQGVVKYRPEFDAV
jgi:putative acetyltransferase